MSSILSKPNKAAALAEVQSLVAGVLKHFPSGSFTLGNTAYTTADLVQTIRGLEDALVTHNAAQATAKDTRTALLHAEEDVAPVIRDLKRFVLAAFSTATPELADFGMRPPKPRKPLDGDQRLAAAAKMRATRVARGTKSKKQTLAIKGNVTGVVVTPVTRETSSAPSNSATPATTA